MLPIGLPNPTNYGLESVRVPVALPSSEGSTPLTEPYELYNGTGNAMIDMPAYGQEDDGPPTPSYVLAAVRLLPLVIAVLVGLIWILGLTIAAPWKAEEHYYGATMMIIYAGFGTVCAIFHLAGGFALGNTLRVGFWVGIPHIILLVLLDVYGLALGDFVCGPIGLVILVAVLLWMAFTRTALRHRLNCY